ncbi:type III pantothenate kinase [Myroides marinus]|uniref:type III pantothenate kinase n=1 Tax=Myroides marinus TaxID=703342 RepID=UPI002575F63F|nr:type III pantothenate kinase [Myroides marinus]MDM1371291.1 type III pantothenate kinase [Myroides marinus]MDM1390994.1 type III pantothenate kinase [Myroides marinus]
MILAIDIGNTRTKIAMFEKDTVLETQIFEQALFEKKIEKILEKSNSKPTIILSSVGKLTEETLAWLQDQAEIISISHQTPFPFKNLYATPNTLGIDRMVLAAGAVIQLPDCNRLVIDAGTCITYEFINKNNEYLGGAISPGLLLRYKALNYYTAKLPLLEPVEIDYLIGNQTDQSIHSGVINGITQEIDGIINQYKSLYPDLKIILTGGDTLFLVKRLKNVIFANSNFLLESLNNLYQYTIENDKKNLL